MKLELFDDDGNYIPNPSEPMSDLISREELLKQIETDSKGHGGQYGDEWLFIDTINSIPTAEPKVGRWKPYLPEYGDMFKCSVCEEVIRLPYKPMRMPYNYCPMCGAKMERRADGDI